jgi:enolase
LKLPQKLRFQEFMVAPTGAPSMAEAVRCGAEVYAALWELIVAQFRSAGVGDEGGFAPDITIPEQALDLLVEAIEQAGYRPGGEVQLALDPAANGFLSGDAYHLGDGLADTGDLIGRYQ